MIFKIFLSLENISSGLHINHEMYQPRQNLMWYSFGMNQQLFDLGLPYQSALAWGIGSEPLDFIDHTDVQFDLVMIKERMVARWL